MQEKIIYSSLNFDSLCYQAEKVFSASAGRVVFILPDSSFFSKKTRDLSVGVIASNLPFFLPNVPVLSIESCRNPIYSASVANALSAANDIATLNKIKNLDRFVLVADTLSLFRKFPPKQSVLRRLDIQSSNSDVAFSDIEGFLADGGFLRTDTVYEPLEYAIRGYIVDIGGLDGFYRIEVVGNKVDRISTFDVETQRKIQSIERIEIFPASEVVLNGLTIDTFLENYKRTPSAGLDQDILRLLSSGVKFPGMQDYLPLFFEDCEGSDIWSYCPKDTEIISCLGITGLLRYEEEKIERAYEGSGHSQDGRGLSPSRLFWGSEKIRSSLESKKTHEFSGYVLE